MNFNNLPTNYSVDKFDFSCSDCYQILACCGSGKITDVGIIGENLESQVECRALKHKNKFDMTFGYIMT